MTSPAKITPADQETRDWVKSALDVSCLLEAGAGTGKTSVLIDRVLEILKTDVTLDRLAIITFTEKAAGELKLRLRREMEKMIDKADPRTSWAKHLKGSLEALDRAAITTIHSFAASLLRERPVEADVDPRFAVADELGARMLEDQTWSRWIERELAAEAAPLARALRLGATIDQIRILARAIVENRDVAPGPAPPPLDAQEARDRILEGIGELGRLADSCGSEQDRACRMIRDLQAQVPELQAAAGDRLIRVLAELPFQRRVGSRENWNPPGDLARVREVVDHLVARCREVTGRARTIVAHELFAWLRNGFLHQYRLAKESRRLLDFTDMILICRNMLRDSRPARIAFQRKFACLLVDEFQDTDPLQAEILFLLAADDPNEAEWHDCRPHRGKLFLVGDPKQSIYRFRRADIEIYDAVKARLPVPADARHPVLSQNFRSVPSIISWVNDLFGTLMGSEDQDARQSDYAPIHAAFDEPKPPRSLEGGATSRVLLVRPARETDLTNARAGQVRGAEAHCVASLIAQAVREGWPVMDRDTFETRSLRYSDIALLFRAGTAFEVYEQVLRDMGVPYHLTGGRRYYLRSEIRSLEAVLRAIESPHDPLAVVSALRCPFFGHSDEDLLSHAARGGWVYTQEGAGRDTPLERAFELLFRLHELRNSRTVAQTLEELFERTGALSLFSLKPDGRQRAANLLKAIDFARTHQAIGGETFGSFVRWLSRMAKDENQESEAFLTEESESHLTEQVPDAVRISTIHRVKGLEFPMVILCDTAARDKAVAPRVVIERSDHGTAEEAPASGPRMHFILGAEDTSFATSGYQEAAEREKKRLEAERTRLSYVAATRARDYLIVPLFSGKARGGFLATLFEQGFLPEDLADRDAPSGLHRGAQLIDGGQLEAVRADTRPLRVMSAEALPEDRTYLLEKEGWRRALKEVLAAPAMGRAFRSASRMEEWTQAPRRAGDGLPAKALGAAVHAVLERIDLRTGRHIALLCGEEADRIGRPDLAEEILALVESTLKADVIKEALAAPRCYREIPFAASGAGYLTQGKADLVFEQGGGLTVVDFKTDRVETKDEIAARAEVYRPQAQIYAHVLDRISELGVRRVVLLFIRPGVTREFQVDEEFLARGRLLLEQGMLTAGACGK